MSIHIEKTKPPSVFFNKWIFSGHFVRFLCGYTLEKAIFLRTKKPPTRCEWLF